MTSARRRPCSAFTLVEAMVAMAVIAILLAITVPVFRNFQASQEVKKASTLLISDLGLAKQWAHTAGVPPSFDLPNPPMPIGDCDLVRYEIKDGETIKRTREYPNMDIQFTGFSSYPNVTRGLHADFYARPKGSDGNRYLFSIIFHPSGIMQESGTITFTMRDRSTTVSANLSGVIKLQQ